jgi:dephospho-CoA kinase
VAIEHPSNLPCCIGLTGGIGSGKSSAARFFGELGASVIDTDHIAHELTATGQPALTQIRERLGATCFDSAGALDRACLRRRVFADADAKRELEAILHPLIRAETITRVTAARGPYIVLVVPLLLETGAYRTLVRRTLVVDCEPEVQVARTVARSGLTPAEVRAIMRTQLSRDERLRHADDIISNDGDLAALRRQVIELDRRYRALADTQKAGCAIENGFKCRR